MIYKSFPVFIFLSTCIFFSSPAAQSQPVDSLFQETEVHVDSDKVALYGSLMVPPAAGKIQVVLIIPGSGPTDRNGNNPVNLKTNCYLLLAKGLYQQGIASLRFDKRGVGKSMEALAEERKQLFGNYVDDAEKWVQFLRKDQRFSKIIVLGHSEGALIGTLAANFERADGFISVSGSGYSADTMIMKQISSQYPSLADTAKLIIEHIKKMEPFPVNKELSPIFRPSVELYLNSWFLLNPVVEISILRCPVMVLQGTTDLQVTTDDANRLAGAKPGCKKVIIENMNHVLKTTSADWDENLATYRNPDLPLAPDLVPAIAAFVKSIR